MKTLLVIATSLFAIFAQADEPVSRTISIKSFVYTENGNFKDQSAELCGVVSGDVTAHDRVTVMADAKSDYAAPYTTLLDKDGKFCIVIRTITGRASAEIWGVSHKNDSVAVMAEIGQERQ
ncbi:MAG: hypothetical protein VX642_09125 [Bdellovibrionota bacterium]|nr:hypothetical protein [Bdellovibrionota bacterium]